MIWHRLSVLAGVFPRAAARDTAETAKRWRAAIGKDQRLAADLIRLGGVLSLQPVRLVDGYPEPEPIDPLRMAYETGRRELALQLLALGNIGSDDLNTLMEMNDE